MAKPVNTWLHGIEGLIESPNEMFCRQFVNY